MDTYETLQQEINVNLTVPTIEGFMDMSDKEIEEYHAKNGFAMSIDDLKYVKKYFN